MPQRQQRFQQNRPANSQLILQMNPSVMPEIAGYCSGCIKTYEQIAVETLTHYVAWLEYSDETVRERNVKSRAFIDGFDVALICFKKHDDFNQNLHNDHSHWRSHIMMHYMVYVDTSEKQHDDWK